MLDVKKSLECKEECLAQIGEKSNWAMTKLPSEVMRGTSSRKCLPIEAISV